MIKILRKAVDDSLATVAWPRGPLLVVMAASVSLVGYFWETNADFGAIQQLELLIGALKVIAAVMTLVFCGNLLVAPYRLQRDRADAAEAAAASIVGAPLDDEQLRRVAARYYDSAHTFVHFCYSGHASVTQNVSNITIHSPLELSFSFVQAIDVNTMRVRPVGGTPKFSIVSCDLWHARVRLEIPADVVQFRVFGRLIPVVRNHPDGSEPKVLAYSGAGRDFQPRLRGIPPFNE